MKIIECWDNWIAFDNGFTMEGEHEQDCCESVYMNSDILKTYNILPHTGESITIGDIEFDEDIENHIELVEDEGFKLVAKDGSKWFVPCYNEQNGYYSGNLDLVIEKGDKGRVVLDITECAEYVEC